MGERESALQSLTAEEAARRSIKEETEEAYYTAYNSVMFHVKPGAPAKGKRCAFVVHSASLLAHVQLMRGVLRPDDRVFVLGGSPDGFRNQLPCPSICLPPLPLPERFEVMRERLNDHQCGTLIWVSVPLYARYAFGLRLAQKQVFWAMRYHPIAPGDLNITAGNRGEKERTFHGVKWTCIHSPINVELKSVDKSHAETLRVPWAYVYGTLAREEKLSPEYLAAIASILHAHPEAGFVWTGRKEPPHIRQFFRQQGLSNRNRFVGWQDPDLFVNTIDCFLETFPLGGLTTFTAMGHGIPIVALNQEHSPIGSLQHTPVGLLAARSSDEYVSMALSLRARETRAKAIAAGHEVFKAEQEQCERDMREFWRVIES